MEGGISEITRSTDKRRDGAVQPGKHNTQTLCSDLLSTPEIYILELCLYNYTVIMGSIPPISRLSMFGWSTSESHLFDEETKTPSSNADSSVVQADSETVATLEARRESRLNTLRVDTGGTESLQSRSRRVSPSGSSGDSPASSTSNHSRQDSTASYTPLRSARGSLSLGVRYRQRPRTDVRMADRTHRELLITLCCQCDAHLLSAERH